MAEPHHHRHQQGADIFAWDCRTGAMSLEVTHSSHYSALELVDLGARSNPKRPFVFVSRVLGKHIAARPGQMVAAQNVLAKNVGFPGRPGAVDETTVFVGMAETATGLGEGVFSQWYRIHQAELGVPQALYLNTTRYPIGGAERVQFDELHCHAVNVGLYRPQSKALRDRMAGARRLVLVDDELSTGRTFAHLVQAVRPFMPRVDRVDVAVLTDFSNGEAERRVGEVPGISTVAVHALMRGRFSFRETETHPLPPKSEQRPMSCRRAHMMRSTPRLGIASPTVAGQDMVERLWQLAEYRPIRLIATGEFMYPAQALGMALEQMGATVLVQSTTRSPLLVGGAIEMVIKLEDPYGEGVQNYIYNPPPATDSELRVVVHEMERNAEIAQICHQLQAINLRYVG
jgi:hypothetical protein